MGKIGLVLEGGASKGVFTAGVMDYLMERKIEFPYVIGVSAGECNALDYVSGQIGRTRDCMIPTSKDDYYFGFRQMVKSRRFFDIERIFDEYPYRRYPFDFDSYFNSPIVNEIVVTNCHTGRAEYLQEKKSKSRLLEISKASASMPIFTPMVQVDGEYYLDGGIADSVPLERAVAMGYEKNVVIMCHNKEYRPRVSEAQMRICRKRYAKYPKLIEAIADRPFMYLKQMAYLREMEKAGKVFVIRPEMPAVGRLEKKQDVLEEFFAHGYQYMGERFEELCKFMEC